MKYNFSYKNQRIGNVWHYYGKPGQRNNFSKTSIACNGTNMSGRQEKFADFH